MGSQGTGKDDQPELAPDRSRPAQRATGAWELLPAPSSELGEGPVWDAEAGRLLWVDTMAGVVNWLHLPGGNGGSIALGQPVGSVALRRAGGLVAAVRDGFALVEIPSGRFQLIAPLQHGRPGNLMNDGKCDPSGIFWAGSMGHDGSPGVGELFRLDAHQQASRVLEGITVSNGIGWSPDGRTMYYVDSGPGSIDAFDYEIESAAISNRRRFVSIPSEEGVPDGLAVDAEGAVWVAIWEGSAIRRYTPNGTLDRVVEFPATLVTSCAFGGKSLGELFVTTARIDLTEEQLAFQPLAGALFRVRTEVPGLAVAQYAG
jgi:sugar lactone lactonase YvrE